MEKPEFIDDGNFFGQTVSSNNRLYYLDWIDQYGSGSKGKYRLRNKSQVILAGRMSRPNDGKVSDNGVFIFCDWGSGDSLSGTFRCYNSSGEKIISHKFRANLDRNALSADGKYALCCTACSDNNDSNVIALFDLEKKVIVLRTEVPIEQPSGIEIDSQNMNILLCYSALGKYRMDFNGRQLDRRKYIEDCVLKGEYYQVLNSIHEFLGEDPASEFTSIALESLDRAINGCSIDPKEQARGFRLKGEVYEIVKDIESALLCYENAIELFPRIGVKKKIESLRKSKTRGV